MSQTLQVFLCHGKEDKPAVRKLYERLMRALKHRADELNVEMHPSTMSNRVDGAEMVLVPAGVFRMGTTDAELEALLSRSPEWRREWSRGELPPREVTLDGYYLYKTPVTVAQYRKFCEATEREMPTAPGWDWKDDHPIVNVTWDDAIAYCKWAVVVLPTEAQWEKAARGPTGWIYPWGDKWDASLCANSVGANNLPGTVAVGSYPAGASPYGCLDMAGNVWEWCADWYDENYYKSAPEHNPSGPDTGDCRVVRGGSWFTGDVVVFRTAFRSDDPPDSRSDGCGFRCVSRSEEK